MPYNFAAISFHTKKLCSRFSSRKVQFSVGKTKKLSSLTLFAVHLRLIGKLVGDVLLVIIELFSLGAFVLSQFTRLTDRQTDDGRTPSDRQNVNSNIMSMLRSRTVKSMVWLWCGHTTLLYNSCRVGHTF